MTIFSRPAEKECSNRPADHVLMKANEAKTIDRASHDTFHRSFAHYVTQRLPKWLNNHSADGRAASLEIGL
jgi:hypothetical protein